MSETDMLNNEMDMDMEMKQRCDRFLRNLFGEYDTVREKCLEGLHELMFNSG